MHHVAYHIHYYIRRRLNYLLFVTVHRLRRGKQIFALGPLISLFSYSTAALDFVERENRDPILARADGFNGDSIVVDVGGETGVWAQKIFDRYGSRLKIYEPNPKSIEVLRERFKDLKAEIFPFGLGSRNQTCLLSDDGMGSSVYESSHTYKESQKVEIAIRDVKEAFEALNLPEVDLIKVNIEGGEYDLLPRLIETGLAKRCRIIRVQFHEWVPNAFAMRRKIVKELARTHDVEWSYPMVWESWIRKESQSV